MLNARTQIAIAVVERDGNFLVGVRPAGQPLAGYDEFPGGRVESGETPEQAAVRECFEETGISVEIIGRYDDCWHDYTHDTVHLHFFECRVLESTQQPSQPFRWVARAELAALQFPEANQPLVRLLAAGEPQ